MLKTFIIKIPHCINILKTFTPKPLIRSPSFYCQNVRNLWISQKLRVLGMLGFSSAVVGVFGAGLNSGGLNFQLSPHYSADESYQNNLKAMIVAMMMTDNLDEDDIAILLNSVQFVYEDASLDCRKQWCLSEMKNFMHCAEKYGNFQHDQCKNFRRLLKSCMSSRKSAAEINPPKLHPAASSWPYYSLGIYKSTNIHQRRKQSAEEAAPQEEAIKDAVCSLIPDQPLIQEKELPMSLTNEIVQPSILENELTLESSIINPSIKSCGECNSCEKGKDGEGAGDVQMDILEIIKETDPSLLENDKRNFESIKDSNTTGDGINIKEMESLMLTLDYEEWARRQKTENS